MDEVVSGRMTPILPALPPDDAEVDAAELVAPPADDEAPVVDLLLPPLELQAASANAATTPIVTTGTMLLRMQLRLSVVGRTHSVASQPIECCERELIGWQAAAPTAETKSLSDCVGDDTHHIART